MLAGLGLVKTVNPKSIKPVRIFLLQWFDKAATNGQCFFGDRDEKFAITLLTDMINFVHIDQIRAVNLN